MQLPRFSYTSLMRPLKAATWPWKRKQGEAGISKAHDALLSSARGELGQSMAGLERAFLKVGEQLEQLDSCSRRLVGQCEHLIHLASGGEEGEKLLRDALEVLKGPLSYLDFCMTQHERLLSLLEQCVRQTEGMLGIRGRMHDAIAPLTFMAFMFKIESAYLPEEHRATFLTVTSEVERLHKLVDETFAQNARQLDLAHTTLNGVRQKLEADFREQARHIAQKRAHIDGAIMTLDQQLARNGERDSRLHDHGSLLASEVSKIVMGLQFQDIIKQKCDHVMEALDEANAGRHSWTQTLGLQVHQMESIKSDLTGGIEVVETGLGRIQDYTEQLNRSSVSLENIESMTAAVDGMVQLLLDSLFDVQNTIGMVAELAEQGFSAVQPASGLARNLTETIVELSINMHLIALNAQVRSVQSGQGTGLELLASRTSEISEEINQISHTISTELGQLHQAIDSMMEVFGQFRNQGREQLEQLGATRPEVETRLHCLRDRTLEAVAVIGSEIEAMRQATGEVKLSLAGLPETSEALAKVQDLLRRALPAGCEQEATPLSIQELNSRYTMASEREVHENFVAGRSTPSAGAAEAGRRPVAPPASQPVSTSVPSPAGTPAPSGDNFEMF